MTQNRKLTINLICIIVFQAMRLLIDVPPLDISYPLNHVVNAILRALVMLVLILGLSEDKCLFSKPLFGDYKGAFKKFYINKLLILIGIEIAYNYVSYFVGGIVPILWLSQLLYGIVIFAKWFLIFGCLVGKNYIKENKSRVISGFVVIVIPIVIFAWLAGMVMGYYYWGGNASAEAPNAILASLLSIEEFIFGFSVTILEISMDALIGCILLCIKRFGTKATKVLTA